MRIDLVWRRGTGTGIRRDNVAEEEKNRRLKLRIKKRVHSPRCCVRPNMQHAMIYDPLCVRSIIRRAFEHGRKNAHSRALHSSEYNVYWRSRSFPLTSHYVITSLSALSVISVHPWLIFFMSRANAGFSGGISTRREHVLVLSSPRISLQEPYLAKLLRSRSLLCDLISSKPNE